MKITGTSSSLTLTCDDGQTIKASGELLTGRRFLVYADSLGSEELTILKAIVRRETRPSTVTILFDDE